MANKELTAPDAARRCISIIDRVAEADDRTRVFEALSGLYRQPLPLARPPKPAETGFEFTP